MTVTEKMLVFLKPKPQMFSGHWVLRVIGDGPLVYTKGKREPII